MSTTYLTPAQVAERLSVHINTVRCWIKTERLSAMNVGSEIKPRWRISESDLQGFIATRMNYKKPQRKRKRTIPQVEMVV